MITRPKPLRVLPCFDSTVSTPSIAVLRSTVGVDLLSVAPASTLIYRTLSEAGCSRNRHGRLRKRCRAERQRSDRGVFLNADGSAERPNRSRCEETSRSLAYSLRPSSGCDIRSIARSNSGYGGGPGSHIGAVRTNGRCICRLKHGGRNRTNR